MHLRLHNVPKLVHFVCTHRCIAYGNEVLMAGAKKVIEAVFYQLANEKEPVRDWLRDLSKDDRKAIGIDIKTAELGWPIGMPIVRKLDTDLWEIRTRIDHRIARVFFTVKGRKMVLLHGIIKKSQSTPTDALKLAKRRKNSL